MSKQLAVRNKTASLFDQFVDELSELRLVRDQADARMLLRLVDIERDHLQVVLDAGYASFASFAQDWAKASRYEAFKLGLARVGPEVALDIGSYATSAAAKLTDGPDEYIDAVKNWSELHHARLPSEQEAQYLLRQVDPRKEVPRSNRRMSEVTKLRAENTELRARIRFLELEVKRLQSTAEDLPPVAPKVTKKKGARLSKR